MGIDAKQLRTLVIRPAISAIGLWSVDAEELMMLTAATESHMGQYLRQTGMSGDSGAFGIFQMEKVTFEMLWKNMVLTNTALRAKIRLFTGYEGKPPVERLMTDLSMAAIMIRLFYYDINSQLPSGSDSYEMAAYYKRWYNTEMGKNTINKAIEDYQNYCR